MPRVLCVDLGAKTVEWQMKWTKHIAVEQLSRKDFAISDSRSCARSASPVASHE